MGSHLKVIKRGKLAQTLPLSKGLLTIGRNESNALVLTGDQVGERHALVLWRDENYKILDLGTSGGTSLNGRRLSLKDQHTSLMNGDILRIGEFDLVFSFGVAAPVPEPGKKPPVSPEDGAKAVKEAAAGAEKAAAAHKAVKEAAAGAEKAAAADRASKQALAKIEEARQEAEAVQKAKDQAAEAAKPPVETIAVFKPDESRRLNWMVRISDAKARLLVSQAGKGKVLKVRGFSLDLGRGDSCQLCLKHPSVSEMHACISWGGDAFKIEDLGSKNGTVVGEIHIGEGVKVPLKPHTYLKFGELECLFIQVPFNDSWEEQPEASSDAATRYLVNKGWISKQQRLDAQKDLRGRASAIAERFITTGVVTPWQWADAYKAAEIWDAESKEGISAGTVIAIVSACVVSALLVMAVLTYFLKPQLFG